MPATRCGILPKASMHGNVNSSTIRIRWTRKHIRENISLILQKRSSVKRVIRCAMPIRNAPISGSTAKSGVLRELRKPLRHWVSITMSFIMKIRSIPPGRLTKSLPSSRKKILPMTAMALSGFALPHLARIRTESSSRAPVSRHTAFRTLPIIAKNSGADSN